MIYAFILQATFRREKTLTAVILRHVLFVTKQNNYKMTQTVL